jgi:hypothetical protein
MENRIAAQLHRAPSAEELKHIFEAAVCELHHPDADTHKKVQYHTPIRLQRIATIGSPASAEKRAVSDAARALAQLWKVPAHAVR